jgi:hypothetical protein
MWSLFLPSIGASIILPNVLFKKQTYSDQFQASASGPLMVFSLLAYAVVVLRQRRCIMVSNYEPSALIAWTLLGRGGGEGWQWEIERPETRCG